VADYSTYTEVRLVHSALENTTDFPNATLTSYIQQFADPEIDATLKTHGFTTPLASVPTLIESISAMLAGAHALSTRARQPYGDTDGLAGQIAAKARSQLMRICTCELDVGLTRDADGYAISVDTNPDERPDTAVIVTTDETQWVHLDETRADS
jgi:hypothetical protein